MDQSDLIEIWVPTRYRLQYCNRMLASLRSTKSDHIKVSFIVDDGLDSEPSSLLAMGDSYGINVKVVYNTYKSSLTKLWNQAILLSEADWVFHSGDDSIFMSGWYESLLRIMESNSRARMIHLLHYGGFAMHKSMVLKVGWFDERFLGGGYEDVDYQYRIAEINGYDLVDKSVDMKKIIHGRHTMGTDDRGHWDGRNNDQWWVEKWSKASNTDFSSACVRSVDEIDWYPSETRRLSGRYDEPSNLDNINSRPRTPFLLK